MNKVVALVGMPGAGKSVVADYFVKRGFSVIYFGGVTIEEVKKRGLEINEFNEKFVREQLRKELGMGAYAVLNLPKIESALESSNVIVDGLYSWSEYKILKEEFGDLLTVVAVVTSVKNRHLRLSKRSVRPLSTKEASSRDYAEIENLEKGGPIANADKYILNDGSFEEFKESISDCFEGI